MHKEAQEKEGGTSRHKQAQGGTKSQMFVNACKYNTFSEQNKGNRTRLRNKNGARK